MSRIFKSEGIIFKSVKYSETSLILDIYTKEKGLQSFIVSGVRKAKSKTINVYHPMNIVDVVAYTNQNGLSRIKEANLAVHYDKIRFDVIRSSIAAFMIDLLRNSIKEKENDADLYRFIYHKLRAIDKSEKIAGTFPIVLCIELAPFLGFELYNNYSIENQYFDLRSGRFIDNDVRHNHILSVDSSHALAKLIKEKSSFVPAKEMRQTLLDHLMTYYSLHIEGFKSLKSLGVLRAVLS